MRKTPIDCRGVVHDYEERPKSAIVLEDPRKVVVGRIEAGPIGRIGTERVRDFPPTIWMRPALSRTRPVRVRDRFRRYSRTDSRNSSMNRTKGLRVSHRPPAH